MTTESTKQGDKRIGRPPEPVPQHHADAIVVWISEGRTLRDYCAIEGHPHFNTVYDWLEKDEGFAVRFARAREVGEEFIAQDCLNIADQPPERVLTEQGDRIDPGSVAHQKNRIDTRLKLLAKFNPKKWGDKVDLTSKGEAVGLVISIDKGPQP